MPSTVEASVVVREALPLRSPNFNKYREVFALLFLFTQVHPLEKPGSERSLLSFFIVPVMQ